MTKPPVRLRSSEWFGPADKNGFMYRIWMKNQGIPDHEFDGRPIIGICNTWSELTPCNAHFRKIAEHAKRGISEAGGFPVEFPVFSNGKSNPPRLRCSRAAASNALLKHRRRAVAYENFEHYKSQIEDQSLDVDASCVLVMNNCGPKGFTGMAEVGNMGLPRKLLRQGVKDMVRLSDARMSGTAYGTVVLHVAPEAADGGPLAAVEDGDWIELDCEAGRLHLDISDNELAEQLRVVQLTSAPIDRSGDYCRLNIDHVLQTDEAYDFGFLFGCRGSEVPRHCH